MTDPTACAWWESLKHGGLLLSPSQLHALVPVEPTPLPRFRQEQLRREANALLDDRGNASGFVRWVFENVLGFTAASGKWQRGSDVPSDWSHKAVTGEIVKPRQLWTGPRGAVLPVFFDGEKRLGVGRGSASQAKSSGGSA